MGRPPGGHRRVRTIGFAAVLLGLVAAGCGGDPMPVPGAVAPSATPAASARPAAVTSPVEGLLTRLDAAGLAQVSGFRLRTDDGTELEFTMGVTENGVDFPPGHLAEHMATTSRVRVFFREEAAARVVTRLEDAE